MNDEIDAVLKRLGAGDLDVDGVLEALEVVTQNDSGSKAYADEQVKQMFLAGELSAPDNYALRTFLGGIQRDDAVPAASEPATDDESTAIENTRTAAVRTQPLSAEPDVTEPLPGEETVTAAMEPPSPSETVPIELEAPSSATQDSLDAANVTPDDESATRIKPLAADERTLPKPPDQPDSLPAQQQHADDATRMREEGTVDNVPLSDPEAGSPERYQSTEPIRGQTPNGGPNDLPPVLASTAPDTGSNWAHPEQWSDGPVGPLQPGQRVGRYVIESKLGAGGMGVVFKARDTRREEAQDANPYVAMKVLSEDFKEHPQSFIALAREWKKAAALSHDNIITVYDFDRIGGVVFMTMELLEGEPLNEVLKKHSLRGLPPERASKIVEGCASALAFAHKKGIVHADFKPGNVFVLPDDSVKVLDFGIARAVPTALHEDDGPQEQTVFDATDLGAMTPAYASASMLSGEAPTPSDDVFALALTAYYLYSGRHPFERRRADDVLERKLTALPLTGPNRRQRRTIHTGMSLEGVRRQVNAGEFLRDWQGLQLPRWVLGAIGTLAVVAVFFAYLGFQEPGPDQPFANLSRAEQQRFSALIAEGAEVLEVASNNGIAAFYDDALELFSAAYAIHPRNPEAVNGLRRSADGWLEWVARQDNSESLLRSGLPKYVCQAYLTGYRPVEKSCRQIYGSDRCSIEGPVCTGDL